jgi:hypothetical protein
MQLAKAQSIMDTVRAFYAGHGPKSCNKVYMKSNNERVSLNDFDKHRTSLLVKMFASAKVKRRNKNREVSWDERWGLGRLGGTPYENGDAIWRAGAGDAVISGNCAEMAFVSIYLAIAEYMAAPASAWYVGIGAPGDHAFCLIGPTDKPTWGSANAMRKLTSRSMSAVIIDPWLHVACHAIDYADMAGRTLQKWHRDGKRVFWNGKDYTGKEDDNSARPGWYDPSGSYAEKFLTSPMTFRGATA